MCRYDTNLSNALERFGMANMETNRIIAVWLLERTTTVQISTYDELNFVIYKMFF